MSTLGFREQKLPRSVFRARDDSPDSVIFTNESGFSAFSPVSGSVERCSFGSDGQDHDNKSHTHELSKHLAGRDLQLHSPRVSDLDISRASVRNSSNPVKRWDESKGGDEVSLVTAVDPARQPMPSLSYAAGAGEGLGSEALPMKHERQRQASLAPTSRLSDATSSSPRITVMKKPAASTRGSGTFPSPGAPNYRYANGIGMGLQKGWSSERVPSHTNLNRRYDNAIPFAFSGGRTLPSKWEDAEKWIFSPNIGDRFNRPAIMPPTQRRPKSKSGPLAPPGMTCYSASLSPSMMLPVFDGGRVENFIGRSPFSAGVLGPDVLAVRGNSGFIIGGTSFEGSGSYKTTTEPCVARSASVHGWSLQSSLPCSQDEQLDAKKGDCTVFVPVSTRNVGTQVSPEKSMPSLPKDKPPSPAFPLPEVQSHRSSKLEIKDVEVDGCVTVTRWSRKQQSRGLSKGSKKIRLWRKKAIADRASDWEVTERTSVSRFGREEAKIISWENLQKAKAEADIRKLEVKLEKMRTSSMDKIMDKLKSAQRKAQEMRSLVSAGENYQISRTANRSAFFHKSNQMNSISGCFTCHAL